MYFFDTSLITSLVHLLFWVSSVFWAWKNASSFFVMGFFSLNSFAPFVREMEVSTTRAFAPMNETARRKEMSSLFTWWNVSRKNHWDKHSQRLIWLFSNFQKFLCEHQWILATNQWPCMESHQTIVWCRHDDQNVSDIKSMSFSCHPCIGGTLKKVVWNHVGSLSVTRQNRGFPPTNAKQSAFPATRNLSPSRPWNIQNPATASHYWTCVGPLGDASLANQRSTESAVVRNLWTLACSTLIHWNPGYYTSLWNPPAFEVMRYIFFINSSAWIDGLNILDSDFSEFDFI